MKFFKIFFTLIALVILTKGFSQTLTVNSINSNQDNIIANPDYCQKKIAIDVNPVTGYTVFVWQSDITGSGNRDIICGINNDKTNYSYQFTVNTTTAGDQIYPSVKINKNDNSFIVTWTSFINNTNTSDPNQYDIYAKKIRFSNIDQDRINSDLLINSYVTGNQTSPIVTFDYTYNEAIIAWTDQNGQDRLPTVVTLDYGSYARRINYSGVTLALISGVSEFRVNYSATVGHQSIISIEVNQVTGDLYCMAQEQNFTGGSGYDIIFRKLTRDVNGNLTGTSESMVNTTTITSDQSNPSITIHSVTGSYAISWMTGGGVGYDCYSKIFDKNGAVIKADFKVAPFVTDNNELAPRLAWDENSGFLIYFHWYGVTGMTSIRYTIFDNTYTKVINETFAISKNLNNYYAGTYQVRYDQTLRKVFLVYDEFNATNSNISTGWYRELIFSTLPVTISTQNYVEIQSPFTPLTNDGSLGGLPVSVANISRNYVDGLGRSIQNVSIQSTPLQKDFVQPTEYDQYGRQVKTYLPYASTSQDGSYKSDYTTAQPSFYNNNTTNNSDRIVNDLYPYKEVVYESTTPNLVSEESGAGNSYKLGSGHTKFNYSLFNTSTDAIRIWTMSGDNAVSSGTYAAGTLQKSQVKDRMTKYTETYTDLYGRLVCKREIPVGCITSSCPLSTYYVYDDFGNTRHVIPPQATNELLIAGLPTWTVNYNGTSNVEQMVFSYKYDQRQRVIEKKIPGQSLKYNVYNKSDQLVVCQDGNQRVTNKWSFFKYDMLGRVVMTGQFADYRTIALIQTDIDTKPLFESRSTSSTSLYTNLAYPITASTDILTINYYDDYNYDFDNNSSTTQTYILSGFSPEPVPATQNTGRLIGTKVKNLETGAWLITINFYDKFGRKIQEQSNNYKNSSISDLECNQYNFNGKILQTKTITNTSLNTITINKRYTYDNTGRLFNTYQKTNSDAEVLLSQLKYNELGQVVEKNLHSENSGSTFLQSVDNTYNVNGSLTYINNSTLTNSSTLTTPPDNNNDANDLFGMQLAYEDAVTGISNTPTYNGKLSAIKWKVNNASTSTTEKSFKFNYDGLYRITGSSYAENNAGTFAFGNLYKETGITYDMNGNITGLQRYNGSGSGVLTDNLTYTYTGTGNQIKSINDASSNTTGFNNRASVATEYTFDPNGNMISDANKGISLIVYNHLNLPTRIEFGGSASNKIEFVYDANGTKLCKRITKAGALFKTLDYIKSVFYDNSQLQYFSTCEGRAIPSGTSFTYQYNLKDHLGNSRVLFDKNSVTGNVEIVQEDNYYPMGMKMPAPLSYRLINNVNNFLYNGKEYHDGIDVNQDGTNEYDFDCYDYGARLYDPIIGTWGCAEPLAENFQSTSLYAYANNDAINQIDIGGLFPGDPAGPGDPPYAQGTGFQMPVSTVSNSPNLFSSAPTTPPISYAPTSNNFAITVNVMNVYNFKLNNALSTASSSVSNAVANAAETVQNMINSEATKNLNSFSALLDPMELGLYSLKEGLMDSRISTSLMDRINSNTSGSITDIAQYGNFAKWAGRSGNAFAGLGTYLDYNEWQDGNMSTWRFGTNLGANVASIGAGAAYGGPAGAAVGTAYSIGSISYDGAMWWCDEAAQGIVPYENGMNSGTWLPVTGF